MKILFDARGFGNAFAGVSKSTLYLFEACQKIDPSIQFIGIIKKASKSYLPETIKVVEADFSNIKRRFTKVSLNRIISETGASFIFFPNNGRVTVGIKKIKVIMTLHDVLMMQTPLIVSQKWQKIYWLYKLYYIFLKKRDLYNSDVIYTASEYSKKEILKYFKLKNEPIVLLLAPTIKPPPEHFYLRLPDYPYFMYAGGYERRKGIKHMLKSFILLHRTREINYKLLMFGKYKNTDNETEELLKQCRELKLVEQVGYVSDEELAYYYTHALASIYLSKYEGFGLPPLEAMSLGCPVVTTRYTSIPEVCGTAAVYVEPDNIDEVSACINKLATDDKYRNELSRKGKAQASLFSWDKVAKTFLDTIYSLK